MVFKYFHSAACIIFTTLFSIASGAVLDTIKGEVSDSSTGSPVDSVAVASEGCATFTDATGAFTLPIPTTRVVQFQPPRNLSRIAWHPENGSFSWSGNVGAVSITVHDMQGNIVARVVSGKTAAFSTFSIANLPQGIYTVAIAAQGRQAVYVITNLKVHQVRTCSILSQGSISGSLSKAVATAKAHVVTFTKSNFDTVKLSVPAGTRTGLAVKLKSLYISCSDWFRFRIPGTPNDLVNNVWNKQSAGTYPFRQCLCRRAAASGDQYGWSWDWPSSAFMTSFAAPEVVFGRKPWDGGASTSPDLPKRIDAIQSLTVDFGIDITASPALYNLNSTMWLTKTLAAGADPDPENILAEVMVRFDDPGHFGGCCSSDGSATLGGMQFDVFHQEGHGDASGGTLLTWNMVIYEGRTSINDAQFDLALVLRDMVSKGLAQPSNGVQGVELITEVGGGKGQAWLKRFNVTVR